MTETTRARKILLCAAGGYQTFMLPGLILSLLRDVCDDVQVVLSRAAARMVSTYAVETASRHKAYVEMDDHGPEAWVPHIELSRDVDLILVYPATVNIVGKVANGIADELIAALILAAEKPVVFVPIANELMWRHPAAARNLATLRADGYIVTDPPAGVEVATREGMETVAPFPMPTLLLQLKAAVRGAGNVKRDA